MSTAETYIRTVPPRPKGYGLMGFGAGLILAGAMLWGWRESLPPVQKTNLVPYVKASAAAQFGRAIPTMKAKPKVSRNEYVAGVLREKVYGGHGVLELAEVPLVCGAVLTLLLVILGSSKDRRFMAELRAGRLIAGPMVVSRAEFNATNRKKREVPGVGLTLNNPPTPKERTQGQEGYVLRMVMRKEPEHFSICGAPGSGKTQTIMQIMDQVAARRTSDRAVVWDQTGVLMERYFDADRGDVVLNPFDARCPSWNPAWELSGSGPMDEALMRGIGSSLYVGRAATTQDNGDFWSSMAIDLWTQLNTHTPPTEARELAYWMDHKEEIDQRVVGTQCEENLSHKSEGLRNSIMAHFCIVKQALAAIPTSKEASQWTVGDWCANGKGWIFVTGTPNTADALRPLQSLWIDMLIRGGMSLGVREDQPATWFFFDELASLQRLPTLESGVNQGRKFNLRFVLGYQAMSQPEYLYGKDQAQAILAAPGVQIYMRTMENNAAEWMSKQCGEQRIEELIETFPATRAGKQSSQSVRTEIRERRVFIASEFMGMPDMAGIFRSGNYLVKIKLPHLSLIKRCEAFIPRVDVPVTTPPSLAPEPEPDPLDEVVEVGASVAPKRRGVRNAALYGDEKRPLQFDIWREGQR